MKWEIAFVYLQWALYVFFCLMFYFVEIPFIHSMFGFFFDLLNVTDLFVGNFYMGISCLFYHLLTHLHLRDQSVVISISDTHSFPSKVHKSLWTTAALVRNSWGRLEYIKLSWHQRPVWPAFLSGLQCPPQECPQPATRDGRSGGSGSWN